VLITGSSQGIGLTLAKGLGSAGAEILLNGRDRNKLARASETLQKHGINCQELAFDVTDHNAAKDAIEHATSNFGDIHVLINNAGMQHRTPLEDFDPEVFALMLQTNIASVFNVGQAVAKHMISRGSGKIINIASVQTALARPGIAPYTTTKGAVANLTKGMAWLEQRTPAGRWGQLDELIGAGIFLSSDAASFINGHTLFVDGGITACL